MWKETVAHNFIHIPNTWEQKLIQITEKLIAKASGKITPITIHWHYLTSVWISITSLTFNDVTQVLVWILTHVWCYVSNVFLNLLLAMLYINTKLLYFKPVQICEIWGSHNSEDVNVVPLGYHALQIFHHSTMIFSLIRDKHPCPTRHNRRNICINTP